MYVHSSLVQLRYIRRSRAAKVSFLWSRRSAQTQWLYGTLLSFHRDMWLTFTFSNLWLLSSIFPHTCFVTSFNLVKKLLLMVVWLWSWWLLGSIRTCDWFSSSASAPVPFAAFNQTYSRLEEYIRLYWREWCQKMLLYHNHGLYIGREVFPFTQAQNIWAGGSWLWSFVVCSSETFWPSHKRLEATQQSAFSTASFLFYVSLVCQGL